MDLSQTSEVHVLRYVEMDLTLESINAMMGIEKTVMVVIKIEMLKKGLHENKMLIIFLIDMKLQDRHEDCQV